MRIMTAALGLVVTAALAAGCSGSEADAESGVSPPLRDSLVESQAADPGEREDRQRGYDEQRNEILLSCMKEAGFDYVAHTPPRSTQQTLGLTEEEFVKRYGLGISTLIDYVPPDGAKTDPNQAIRAGLSDSAGAAYDRKMADCGKKVIADLGIPPAGGKVSLPDDVAAALDKAVESTGNDATVLAARKQYQACLAGRGYPAGTGELGGEITERVKPYAEKFVQERDRLVEQGGTAADVKLADVLDQGELTKLAGIQRYELAVSRANWECGRDYVQLQTDVQRGYLKKYLDAG